MPKPRHLFSLLLVFFFSLVVFFKSFFFSEEVFKVVKVVDGDTIELVDGRVLRYIGIDSPELGKGKEVDQCFSLEAKKINQDLVLGQEVSIELDLNEMDRFGRWLAYVYLLDNGEEIFVNQYLLEQGVGEFRLDTVNLKYQESLVRAAEKGYLEKKGVWSVCAPNSQLGCLIKGNLDKMDQRWYHLPEFRHYSQVKVNLEQGDRWFCTEEAAVKAGFERARE